MIVKKVKFNQEVILLLFLNISSLVILFAPFLIGKYVYMYPDWGYDTYHQFVPEIELLSDSIRNGNIASLFSFKFGLGSDLFSLQKWITDPFVLIIIIIATLTKTEYIPYLMILNPILISIASSILCYFYLKLFKKYKKYGLIISSYVYGICGYLVATGQHYWFASFLVYNILTLLFIELMMRNKKYRTGFIIVIFFVSMHGAYGAFPILLSSVVYLVVRILFSSNNLKKKCIELIDFLICILIGFLMSMVVFLPNLYEIIHVSGRVSSENIFIKAVNAFHLIDKYQLKTAILRLFSNNLEGTVNYWSGVEYHFTAFPYYFSLLFVVCLAQFFANILKKGIKSKLTVVTTLIILFCILLDFVPQLFNLFSYSQYRMIYVLLPFFAITIAETVGNVEDGFYSVKAGLCSSIVFSFVLFYLINQKQFIFGGIICFLIFLLNLLLFYLSKTKNKKTIKLFKIVICAVVVVNLIGDHAISLYYERNLVSWEDVKNNYYNREFSDKIKYINDKEKDNFYRVDKSYLGNGIADANASYIFPYRSVSTYNSILNHNTKNFISNIVNGEKNSFGDLQMIYAENNYGFLFNNIMADLLGIKYIISNKQRDCRNWNLIQEDNHNFIYENKNIETAGILYSSFITEEEFEDYNILNKNLILGKSVVVNKKPENAAHNISELLNINYYQILDRSGSILANKELVIPVKEENQTFHFYQTIISFCLNTDMECNMNIYIESSKAGKIPGTAIKKVITPDENQEFAISIPEDTQNIILEFDRDIMYELNNIKISSISNEYITNNVNLKNKEYRGFVNGEILAEKDSLLYVAIPYLKGWKSYVDGVETDIYRANYGFMAIEVSSGKHQVVFKYSNPIIKIGLTLSFIGLLLAFIYLYYMKRKKVEHGYRR